MKKIITKTLVILTISACIFGCQTQVFAGSFWSGIEKQADNFIKAGEESPIDLTSGAQKTVEGIGQLLTTIGFAIILVGFLILGIKYMTASPEEAAKVKKQLVGLSISAVVLFGAFAIWRLVGTILENQF